ncbi:response regulator [Sandaracinus amylolyticus]|uniref:Response regulatory domain-containing protein n=1 Tax=Sandaracinus amylolyticus TaxID=927083 RepID=A0A0F6SGF9_9BACT|nr:response regulator [Sandaracinus amylolyticus]AKF08624.1 hypothetical protein DB32_005773 [Sandaracinus amylolyticus]
MPPIDGASLRVLLVDDNVLLASLLRRVLEEMACEVVTAPTADVARPAIETGDFDVIVCDGSLTALDDGFAVLAHAREHSPRSLRVLLSGRPPDALPDDATVERFAMKPMLSDDLRELLGWARTNARRAS